MPVTRQTQMRQHTARTVICAQVAVAEMAIENGREVVVYRVRVAAGGRDWTVLRRFRQAHAASLHASLRLLLQDVQVTGPTSLTSSDQWKACCGALEAPASHGLLTGSMQQPAG